MSEHESSGEFLRRVGTDADKWADEFLKRYNKMKRDDVVAWFANALEAGRAAGINEIATGEKS